MKNLLLLSLILISLSQLFSQQEIHKKVKIFYSSETELREIFESGAGIDHFSKSSGGSIEAFLTEKEIKKISSAGIRYEVLIEDWIKYYNDREKMSKARQGQILDEIYRNRNIKGFGFGSMGGYYTFDEIVSKLDSMHLLYPDIISQKYSIGKTLQNRDQWVVKISDNPNIDEDEPEVFYNSLIHAREPAAMMAVIYYMYYLLENYSTDPAVKYLVDTREMYFMPVINPDGYEYNRTSYPNGGGMWRKNLSDNYDGSKGVDLNRNWGYQWGYDDNGSSPIPTDATYRGPAPFSEPETNNLRVFVNSRNFRLTLNYHTYSNLLILPWGYIPEETEDSLIFREYAKDMTQFNNYTWGISADIIYPVNGDTDDWMYGEQTEKEKILTMTPEVGSGSDGFWPDMERIFPLAEENLYPNLYLAWAAGDYVSLSGYEFSSDVFNAGKDYSLIPKLKNKGLEDAYNISVSILNKSPYISTNANSIEISSLKSRTEAGNLGQFDFHIAGDAPTGAEAFIEVATYSNDIQMSTDTIRFFIGTPSSVFTDLANDISTNWVSYTNRTKKWEVINNDYYSSGSSFTDSKVGNYVDNSTVRLTLTENIDLSGISAPRLGFWTKWDIEADWDCGEVQISTDNGSTWTALAGIYTSSGSGQGKQPLGGPVYHGKKNNWVFENIDLSSYSGKKIKIRFELRSDEYITGDGWFVDDIRIFYYKLVPVELTNFTATTVGKSIKLEWGTASELNNYGFEVHKSIDKTNWRKLFFKSGKGTTSESNLYSVIDDMPSSGKSFYRLVQIDLDGSKTYYDALEVNFTANLEFSLDQNFPNPFNPSTEISYTIDDMGLVKLSIYNALGQKVKTLVNIVQEPGQYKVSFNANGLSNGIYFYNLQSGIKNITRKMMLVK